MNKNSKFSRLPVNNKDNKTMGFLPLDYDRSVFNDFEKKISSLNPFAGLIVHFALYTWNRPSDEVIENGVTKKYFNGNYSNKFFHKNLSYLIQELEFSCTEGKPRQVYPLHLLKREGTFDFMVSKYRHSNVSPSSEIININSFARPSDTKTTVNTNLEYQYLGIPYYQATFDYTNSFFDLMFSGFDRPNMILYYVFQKYNNFSYTEKTRMSDIASSYVNTDFLAKKALEYFKDKNFIVNSGGFLVDEYYNNDNSAKYKSMFYFISILKQARDFLLWAESDNFEVRVESNFDLTKIETNEQFIQNQLNFMNSMSDTVQREITDEKVEWQQKKDELNAEIEIKKKNLSDAIQAKRTMVANLLNAKSVKDSTLKSYIVELEKRYITE